MEYWVQLGAAYSPPLLGCSVVCYANDTIILAEGESWGEALSCGEMAVATVIRSIHAAGLKVAAQKTEVLLFYNRAMT